MLKNNYNRVLSSYKYAEIYMNDPNISIERKLKRVPEVQKITVRLSKILESIENYTIDEALDGFGFEERAE